MIPRKICRFNRDFYGRRGESSRTPKCNIKVTKNFEDNSDEKSIQEKEKSNKGSKFIYITNVRDTQEVRGVVRRFGSYRGHTIRNDPLGTCRNCINNFSS